MELLNKSMNEVVRNEALLLMIELTKDRKDGKLSKQIQKMVGFHSAFEKVLDIIQEEGKDAPRTHHCTHHCTHTTAHTPLHIHHCTHTTALEAAHNCGLLSRRG